jgi:hypothetical protein
MSCESVHQHRRINGGGGGRSNCSFRPPLRGGSRWWWCGSKKENSQVSPSEIPHAGGTPCSLTALSSADVFPTFFFFYDLFNRLEYMYVCRAPAVNTPYACSVFISVPQFFFYFFYDRFLNTSLLFSLHRASVWLDCFFLLLLFNPPSVEGREIDQRLSQGNPSNSIVVKT